MDGERDLERVDLLNENSAVTAPHMKLGKRRGRQISLFEKVERGQPLSVEESATYRVLYQSILKDKQSELKLLDHQLTVVTDFRIEEKNNVGTFGIEGSHDHHDASAAENLSALRRDLVQLEQASGATASFVRVRAAISAYKNLTTSLRTWGRHRRPSPCPMSPRPCGRTNSSSAMMVHYKRAQFDVNSRVRHRGSSGPGQLRCSRCGCAGPRLRSSGADGAKPQWTMGQLKSARTLARRGFARPNSRKRARSY
jgi:hypothetical protein